MHLIRELSFICGLRFNVRGEQDWCLVVGVRGRDGGPWWLPAGDIRASQGTFSSLFILFNVVFLESKKHFSPMKTTLKFTFEFGTSGSSSQLANEQISII